MVIYMNLNQSQYKNPALLFHQPLVRCSLASVAAATEKQEAFPLPEKGLLGNPEGDRWPHIHLGGRPGEFALCVRQQSFLLRPTETL